VERKTFQEKQKKKAWNLRTVLMGLLQKKGRGGSPQKQKGKVRWNKNRKLRVKKEGNHWFKRRELTQKRKEGNYNREEVGDTRGKVTRHLCNQKKE